MKILRATITAILLTAIFSGVGWSASYFVNINTGNNSAAGTSTAPWKTAPGMNGNLSNSKSLSPGDVIYFAPGQVWAAQITGSGPASGLLTTLGGVTYKTDTAVYNPDNKPAGTKAILRATGKMSNALVQFRDHPTQETVIDNLELDGNNQITQGVDINHRYSIETSMTGAWKKILNCYLHDMLGNMAGGDYKYGISARTNVENIWIENTEVFNPPREGIVMYSDAGTYIENVIIRHCFVHGDSSDGQPRGRTATSQYKNGSGICLKGDVRNALVEFNTAYNIRSQALFIFDNGAGSTPSNFTIRYNVFHSNGHSGDGGTGVCRITGDGTKSGDFHGNVILPSPDYPNNPLIYKDGSGTWTGNIYNNTLINGSGVAMELSRFSGNVRNNIVSGGSIPGGGSNNITGGTFSGFKDINNVPVAAFFTGDSVANYQPTRDGLSLKAGSAGLGAGANLGTKYAGSINSVGRGDSWDAGAYQSGGNPPPVEPPPVEPPPVEPPPVEPPPVEPPPVEPPPAEFVVGDLIQVDEVTTVRSRTSTGWFSSRGTQEAEARGVVVAGPTVNNNGTWYNIDFTVDPDGWVLDGTLIPAGPVVEPPPVEPPPVDPPTDWEEQIAALEAQVHALEVQVVELEAQLVSAHAATAQAQQETAAAVASRADLVNRVQTELDR